MYSRDCVLRGGNSKVFSRTLLNRWFLYRETSSELPHHHQGYIIKCIDKATQNWILLKTIDIVIPLCSEHQHTCDSHMTLLKSKMANNNGLHRFHAWSSMISCLQKILGPPAGAEPDCKLIKHFTLVKQYLLLICNYVISSKIIIYH